MRKVLEEIPGLPPWTKYRTVERYGDDEVCIALYIGGAKAVKTAYVHLKKQGNKWVLKSLNYW